MKKNTQTKNEQKELKSANFGNQAAKLSNSAGSASNKNRASAANHKAPQNQSDINSNPKSEKKPDNRNAKSLERSGSGKMVGNRI